MSAPELKAFLIGGDKLFRECLSTLLGSHFTVIAEGAALESAMAAGREMPHVVLWLRIPPYASDIVSEANEIRSKWPLTRIIVLSRRAEVDDGIWPLLSGPIDALLSLDMNVTSLDHAVRAVLCGERLLSTELLRVPPPPALSPPDTSARGWNGRATPDKPSDLTPRQREVLKALAAGLPNKIIARKMDVTEATIKVQVRYILRKIGAGNRTQAAIWARENGFGAADGDGRTEKRRESEGAAEQT